MAMDYNGAQRSRCSACQLRCASKDGAVRERGIGYRIKEKSRRPASAPRKTVGFGDGQYPRIPQHLPQLPLPMMVSVNANVRARIGRHRGVRYAQCVCIRQRACPTGVHAMPDAFVAVASVTI